MLAVVEVPIKFFFQSLVKQIFVVIAEAVLHRCFPRKTIWLIPVINVKRNNFINNGQMSWGDYYFILFSFDQNLNSLKMVHKPIFLSGNCLGWIKIPNLINLCDFQNALLFRKMSITSRFFRTNYVLLWFAVD